MFRSRREHFWYGEAVIKGFVISLLAFATLCCVIGPALGSEPLDLFNSEAAAREHCHGDTVVWLNVPEKRYFLKGQRGYGTAKYDGGFTCRRDAVKTHNHPLRATR